MARRLKLLTGLSTVAVAGALALGGCGAEGEAEGEGEAAAAQHVGHSEGEGEGEGEGGAGMADPATDDVAYLTQLGLVRGHLKAFHALYQAGARGHASSHVKHPESELYADLVPAFAARGNDGFADALNALVAANEAGEGVDEAYAATIEAIRAVEPETNAAETVLTAANLARIAADEYAIGVAEDGSLVNLHEYQDAYGFLSVAREMLDETNVSDAAEREAVETAQAQIDRLLARFDGWTPETAALEASEIYGAAARVEIAGLGLARG